MRAFFCVYDILHCPVKGIMIEYLYTMNLDELFMKG